MKHNLPPLPNQDNSPKAGIPPSVKGVSPIQNGDVPSNSVVVTAAKNQAINDKIKKREALIMVVVGMTGVGKTYGIVGEVKNYITNKPHRKGRPAFIFDINGEELYEVFRQIDYDKAQFQERVCARRILAINPDGSPMDSNKKIEVVTHLVKNVKGSLLVFDDIDKYYYGSKGRDVMGIFMANRHSGLDVIFTHQSLGNVNIQEFRNMTIFKLYNTVDVPTKSDIRKKLDDKFDIIYIAHLIIRKQYNIAKKAFEKGLMKQDEWDRRKSYHLYIDVRKYKIYGNYTKEMFREACMYLISLGDKIPTLMKIKNVKGQPMYANESAAINAALEDYESYFSPNKINKK